MADTQSAQPRLPPPAGTAGGASTNEPGVAPLNPPTFDTRTTTIDATYEQTNGKLNGEAEKSIAWREEKLEPSLPSPSTPDSNLDDKPVAARSDAPSSHGGKGHYEQEDGGSGGHSGFVSFGKKLGEMFGTPKRRPPGLKWRSASWFITAVVAVGVTMDVLAYVSFV